MKEPIMPKLISPLPRPSLALTWALMLALLCSPAPAQQKQNIDLSTVPPRASVQLTIYNAEDLTLVRETRRITFKEGHNRLQFAWANTKIDPTSVQVRFLEKQDQLDLRDTTFPHDKPEQLYWNIESGFAGEAKVQISYFTSGISWEADYVGILSPNETHMGLTGYVTVDNNSGEDYENADVRLVVGQINLEQKIRELAERGILRRGNLAPEQQQQRAMRETVRAAEAAGQTDQPKEVAKEGLSEYYIFSIEGTETVPHTWAKRMESFDAAEVPVDGEFRYRRQQYGDQLVRILLLMNVAEDGLGEAPLPNGTVRVFRRDDEDSLHYLTRQRIQYVPIGDELELNLGPSRDVMFEEKTLHVFRDQIWAHVRGVDVLHRLDQPGVQFEAEARVVGWNEHRVYEQRIHNHTSQPIEVAVRRQYDGDTLFQSELGATRHDYQTVTYTVTVEAREKAALPYEVVRRKGRNAEQDRLQIETAEPAPVPWRSDE